jgi:hypothetical protein
MKMVFPEHEKRLHQSPFFHPFKICDIAVLSVPDRRNVTALMLRGQTLSVSSHLYNEK